MEEWSIQYINDLLEQWGGCSFELVDVFPFNKENKKIIKKAYKDKNINDSALCDLILKLAYDQVEQYNK